METIIAILIGLSALNAQPHTLPDKFVGGAVQRGTPVITQDFIGLEWDCAPRSKRVDETCWAGYNFEGDGNDGYWTTGP